MLTSLTVKRFKSLADVGKIELRPLTVLFGPNAAGKSNLLDAVQLLSRLVSEKTLAEAFTEPVRGLALEAFMFPPEGLAGLLSMDSPSFRLEADLSVDKESFRYGVEVAIRPSSGTLSVEDELLQRLNRQGEPRGEATISRVPGTNSLRIRRTAGSARPRDEAVGLGYTQLSDRRFSGQNYRNVDKVRNELSSWRTYYLDPRVAMRAPRAPQEVDDVGALGEHIAPFLYRLKADQPKAFRAVQRTLRTLIPSVEDLSVDLDRKRGVLDVEIRQNGTPFSSRVVSEGTLRVLALTCIAANPFGQGLVSFEEPENGVHPRRIELIAQMLHSMATREEKPRQVLVTTHSPVFISAILREARRNPRQIAIYNATREGRDTRLRLFDATGPLFENEEIAEGLAAPTEDAVVEGMLLRGLLDA
jgi:predicted ATPase